MKNLLLLLAMLITTSTVFSQLTVKPNGTTDSYIYVKDEVLFVEQDINLQVNPGSTTKASLYLRNGAQLIQGSTVNPLGSINDGDGQISVYQNAPDSDRWTYNYWCSPVGNETITGAGNKNFGLYRLYDIQGLTASNVTKRTTGRDGTKTLNINSTAPDLTISTRWLYTHLRGTETEGDYERINANDAVPAGMGFIMKGVDSQPVDINANGTQDPEDGFEYDFRGRPNNGDMSIQVYVNELTLSGNPYPSALDLNRVFYDSDNGEIGHFAFWDEDKNSNSHYYSQNAGGYGTWVPNGQDSGTTNAGTYTAPIYSIWDAAGNETGNGSNGTGDHYERRFAPIGQGFMIVPDITLDGTVTIKNSHRRYIKEGVGNFSEFRRPGGDVNIDPNPIPDPNPDPIPIPDPPNENILPQLRINTSFSTSHIRQMVLTFSEDCTDGYDRGFDGLHPMDAVGGDVYFPISRDGVEDQYVIQGINFSLYKKIPVNFTLSHHYDLTVEVIEEINFYGEAYLLDRNERTYKQITNGQKAEFSLDAGDYNQRFAIVFRNHRQAVEEPREALTEEVTANIDFFQNNPYKQMEVSNPEGYDINTAAVYDMTGKLVATKSNVGTVTNFTISTSNLSDGVYLVKLITSEKIEINYKTIIRNK